MEKILPQKRMECFRLLLERLAWIGHQFLSGIRDSRKAERLWGMMRGVGGVRKSIHQSWLAKWLGLELLCWGFKGVQEEIPREEASTLQIGSVAFPPGRCTSPQLHPCHRLFEQDGHQDSSLTLPIVQTLLPVTFVYSLRSEAVVMRQLRRWKRLAEVLRTVQQLHCSRRRFFRSFMCVLSIKVSIRKMSEIYLMILVYTHFHKDTY